MQTKPGFLLLEDFEPAYDAFPLKVIDLDDRLKSEIREPMAEALAEHVSSLRALSLDEIHSLTADVAGHHAFVVTMDGGVCFADADCTLDITRTALELDLCHSERNYYRLPRAGSRQFVNQGLRLRSLYEERGSQRPIILCDDGIGTGRSLERIVQLLADLNLDVREIVVLANPRQKTQIRDIPVRTLLSDHHDHIWLNERDLYWGLPRSGVSLALQDASIPVCGVPYTIDTPMVESRIGLTGAAAAAFRDKNLAINAAFWRWLERGHNRELSVHDCSWLRFLDERFGEPDLRIVDFLEGQARTSDFMLIAPATAGGGE